MKLNKYLGLDNLILKHKTLDLLCQRMAGVIPFFPVVQSDALIGIEVEAEGFSDEKYQGCDNYRVCRDFFGTVADGSLRDNGVEFVSAILNTEQTGFALGLMSYLNKTLKLKYNDRTGVHVHLNMREMELDSFRTFIATYLMLEKSLFHISGNRYNNIFCLPLRKSRTGLDILFSDNRQDSDVLEWFFHKGMASKYMALNYLPLTTFGTVEFRHHCGIHDVDRLRFWIDVILRIYNFAVATPFKEIQKVIFALNTNSQYREFLSFVLKDTSRQFLGECEGVYVKDMEKGIATLKDLHIKKQELYDLLLDRKKSNAIKGTYGKLLEEMANEPRLRINPMGGLARRAAQFDPHDVEFMNGTLVNAIIRDDGPNARAAPLVPAPDPWMEVEPRVELKPMRRVKKPDVPF